METEVIKGKTKVSKYALLAHLYFFFNSVGLAGGLLYTNLLTPFFYIWIALKKRGPVLHHFFFFLVPFDLIHLVNGVELKSFLVSNLLLLSTYIFVVCFSYFINHYEHTGRIYRQILVANFVFTLLAMIIYFTPFRDSLWYVNKFTRSVEDFYRLALLTFEASYYSLIFTPIAFYYLLKVFFSQNRMSTPAILVMVMLPLILSLSLGVLGMMALTAICLYLLNWPKIFYKKNFLAVLITVVVSGLLAWGILAVFFPGNALFVRLENILAGVDTSANGRTSESFSIAWLIAKETSIWFGAGLGQIKVQAVEIVRKYYYYWGNLDVVRIPNAVAETLAIFGITGIIVRFALIIYLFFKTRVLSNYYRTALFLFIFFYQFTGSYITNIAEYVIWSIAFSGAFREFERRSI